ncbi:hypothetical protein [Lysinibacillus sp.]|uniref:hypothetical protein n=1 Tax=Lysinibacillus sp. TaxID=1869345 RepID=UPI0028A77EFB|nr:hypothetical protein [Lysinibacillus sp.]
MFRTSKAKSIDRYGRKYSIDNIEFTIEKWEFSIDGMYGHIYFTVKKGSYLYGANNGAYCSKLDEDYDLISVATPCFLDENGATERPLSQIFKEAIEFADLNLLRG